MMMTIFRCRYPAAAAIMFCFCFGTGDRPAAQESGPAARGVHEAVGWDTFVRVSSYTPGGFPCFDRVGKDRKIVRYYYFKHPLRRVAEKGGWATVTDGEETCLLQSSHLRQMHQEPVLCPDSAAPMPLVPLEQLVRRSKGAKMFSLEAKDHLPLGLFFPTFYHIAMEQLYPPEQDEEKVRLLDNDGKTISRVGKVFRRALMKQGTGSLVDGRVLNVGRKHPDGRRFIVLPGSSYGLGVSGYHLYPYRSAAVDFNKLCERLGGHAGCDPNNVDGRDSKISRKNRKALAGSLLYLPQLAGAKLAGGEVHDGYVCAVDVGGGIKNERIDLFVGTDGAGNPYYPACRRDNPLIDFGVKSLVPSDWHHFEQDDGGNWHRLVQTEFRQVARHKGLEVLFVPGVTCRREVAP